MSKAKRRNEQIMHQFPFRKQNQYQTMCQTNRTAKEIVVVMMTDRTTDMMALLDVDVVMEAPLHVWLVVVGETGTISMVKEMQMEIMKDSGTEMDLVTEEERATTKMEMGLKIMIATGIKMASGTKKMVLVDLGVSEVGTEDEAGVEVQLPAFQVIS